MPFTSRFNHSASLNAHYDKHYTKRRFGRITSISYTVALTALLIWAFAPLTTGADYKAVTFAKAIEVVEQPTVKAAQSFKTLELVNSHPQPKAALVLASVQTQLINEVASSGRSAKPTATSPADIAVQPAAVTAPIGSVKTFTVQSGDTLSKLFREAGIPLVLAIKLDRTKEAKKIQSLKPGRELTFYFNAEGQWETLEYTLDKLTTLIIVPNEAGFQVSEHKKEVTYETFAAAGLINSSLGLAGEKAGLSYNMISKLVDIFKWEIDFAGDIQSGDHFNLIYQKAYLDNKFIDDGEILVAEFWNRGKSIQAVRFENSAGNSAYYKPNGASLQRSFLRTPIEIGKVTSGFSKSRLHPIKNTWKAHKGVDYGAKSGTPILATGDGTVQYAGKKRGYGNTVILRHGGKYTTLYAHMRKFGKGIRTGKRITQGQTIGYVGTTGWATGPHLHYEFRVNGLHKNPLKVEFPRTDPVSSSDMPKFTLRSKVQLNALAESVQIKTASR